MPYGEMTRLTHLSARLMPCPEAIREVGDDACANGSFGTASCPVRWLGKRRVSLRVPYLVSEIESSRGPSAIVTTPTAVLAVTSFLIRLVASRDQTAGEPRLIAECRTHV